MKYLFYYESTSPYCGTYELVICIKAKEGETMDSIAARAEIAFLETYQCRNGYEFSRMEKHEDSYHFNFEEKRDV